MAALHAIPRISTTHNGSKVIQAQDRFTRLGAAAPALETGMSLPHVLRVEPGQGATLQVSHDIANHNGQPINRDHDLPFAQVAHKTETDQHGIRQQFMTVAQHLATIGARHPEEQIIGFVSNGNVLTNPGFVGWQERKVYHLRDEPVYRRSYSAIVVWKDGRVSVEEVWFARENGHDAVLKKAGEIPRDITAEVAAVESGQRLIHAGQPIPLAQFTQEWYDTRHLVRSLRLVLGKAVLFVPNGQLQAGLLHKAFGQPVQIRLEAQPDAQTTLPLSLAGLCRLARTDPHALDAAEAFLHEQGLLAADESLHTPEVLVRVAETIEQRFDEALAAGGYRLVDTDRPLVEGEARFVNGHLDIFFRKAVYPHTIFARWPDGGWGFVVFPGQSGRSGTTLPHAQAFLTQRLGVQDAILLDNGGDTRLWYRGQYLVPSSEGREEIRAVLAVTLPKGAWCGDAVSVF
ncbi:MAG: phosphodiester glycosidase family protein [Anaerolineae bacterium]|nr:phosphodiester glycosidase family protein [Anaerolineae bacterium]